MEYFLNNLTTYLNLRCKEPQERYLTNNDFNIKILATFTQRSTTILFTRSLSSIMQRTIIVCEEKKKAKIKTIVVLKLIASYT